MTNSEYFEKNNISFADAMKFFNKQKDKGIKSFDKFLAFEHVEHKFNVGDLIVLQRDRISEINGWLHNVVLKIVKINEPEYSVEFLTPDGSDHIGDIRPVTIEFIDRNCIMY